MQGQLGRRELLMGAAALATVSAVGANAAHHDKHEHGHAHAAGDERLAKAALDCVGSGDACISHCLTEFKQGRTELAECAARVEELVAACRTLAQLAAHGSPHTKAFAAVTADVCRTCETECRKHAKHDACKACAEDCAACIEQCNRVTG